MPEPSAPTPSPTPMRSERGERNDQACTSSSRVDVPEDRRQRDLLAEEEEHHRRERADEAAQQALEHERSAHEPVRRADELHHLDLASPREDREPDRVRDQQHRRASRSTTRDEEDDLDHARDLEDALRGLLAVLDRLDAGELLRADRAAIAFTSSALRGVTSNEAGSGFDGRFAVSSGYFFCILFSASAFETNWYSLIPGRPCRDTRRPR